MAETLSTRKRPVIKNAAGYFGREMTRDGDDLGSTISVLAQEPCRSRRAPGREPGANENAALFSIQWPMRYQGFLANPARLLSMRSGTHRCKSLGQDLSLLRWFVAQRISGLAGQAVAVRSNWTSRSTCSESLPYFGPMNFDPVRRRLNTTRSTRKGSLYNRKGAVPRRTLRRAPRSDRHLSETSTSARSDTNDVRARAATCGVGVV